MIRTWLAGAGLLLASLCSTLAAEESVQVTVTGTLKTGILAVGAETTGTTITARNITWELDFREHEDLKAEAKQLNNKQVTVTGTLEHRTGVEVKERWIVTVSSLKVAEKPKQGADDPAIEAVGVREGTKATINSTPVAGSTQLQTTVDIRCERGIDGCELKRTKDAWPTNVVLHLRLRGLESLKVSHGNATLEWSVSSSAPYNSTSSYRSGKRGTTLEPTDPLFTSVELIGNKEKGTAGIPLDGYFAVTVPGKFLESNPEQVRVQWIDFYR